MREIYNIFLPFPAEYFFWGGRTDGKGERLIHQSFVVNNYTITFFQKSGEIDRLF